MEREICAQKVLLQRQKQVVKIKLHSKMYLFYLQTAKAFCCKSNFKQKQKKKPVLNSKYLKDR